MSHNANVHSNINISFPQECLVGSLGDFAKSMASNSEVPEEFYFAAGLTVLGHMCRTDLQLNNDLNQRPNFYTVLLGKSGVVRKSTAVRKTIEFFQSIGYRMDVPNICYGVGSAEGLAKLLERDKDILVALDEMRALIDKCGIKNSVLMPMAATLFELDQYQNETTQNKIRVDKGHLSILGCCTSDTYEAMWTPAAIAIGLPNRLFIVQADAKPRIAWPARKSIETLNRLRAKFKQQLHRLPITLDITSDALQSWEQWYHAQPHSIHSTRLDTLGFRLMGVMALTMDKQVVDAEVVDVVTKILDYEFRVRVATDPVDADNQVAALEEKIRRVLSDLKPGRFMRNRDLQIAVKAHRKGIHLFTLAVNNLVAKSDEVEESYYMVGKRKTPMYRLKPSEESEEAAA